MEMEQSGYESTGPGSSYIMLIPHPIHREPIKPFGLVFLAYKSILTPVYPTIPYRPSWNSQNVRPISLPLPFSLLGLV
jgi:hypothetical protein